MNKLMGKFNDKKGKKKEKKRKKKMTFIVATTSLPVNRPNADRLERRTLVPMMFIVTTYVVASLLPKNYHEGEL